MGHSKNPHSEDCLSECTINSAHQLPKNINDSDLENITAEDILASIGGAAK